MGLNGDAFVSVQHIESSLGGHPGAFSVLHPDTDHHAPGQFALIGSVQILVSARVGIESDDAIERANQQVALAVGDDLHHVVRLSHERGILARVVPESVAVEPVQTVFRTQPDKAERVLVYGLDRVVRQTVRHGQLAERPVDGHPPQAGGLPDEPDGQQFGPEGCEAEKGACSGMYHRFLYRIK